MSKRMIVMMSVVWMVVLVASVSSSLTLSLCGVASGDELERDIVVTREQYEMIERYSRLQEVMDIIQSDYYEEVDEETLITGALRGMMDSLGDPYTFYYTPEEMAETNEHQEGEYEGVGIQVLGTQEGEMIVTRAFKGGSAYEEGILPGDRIVAVEDTPVSAETVQTMNDAVALIKGEVGTKVRITVVRDGISMEFVLERRKVNINRVEFSMLEDNIGYIMLYEFMGDDVEGFTNALKMLKRQGAEGLIIDVRSNPGGMLYDVVDIVDELIPEGLIVYIENRAGARDSFYSGKEALDMPLVVLVNEHSASASEILAGAVQDTGTGIVVGETTFGKGIVQTVIPFVEDGAGLQLTTATYYTPNGRSIHGSGITPDVIVEDGGYDFTTSTLNAEEDPQLKEAVSVLREAMENE